MLESDFAPPPKTHTLKSKPPMQLGHEGGALMNRIRALTKETPELPHAFRYAKTVRRELCGALILDFPASRLWGRVHC